MNEVIDYTAIKAPKSLLKLVGQALVKHQMIQDGDRVLLGVSGGKDSLTLLHVLKHFQRHAPVKFELAAITVDPQVPGFEPKQLQAYMDAMGIPWFFESQPIMDNAKGHMSGDSYCSWCARMKRGIMYTTCRREGYNVLALAQHLDDLAESFLMSAFYNGQLRTMKANYWNDDKDIRVIRPLIEVRENQTRDFAESSGLPIIPDNCPACFTMPTERQHMKELLLSEAKRNKNLYKSLFKAMAPLISDRNDG